MLTQEKFYILMNVLKDEKCKQTTACLVHVMDYLNWSALLTALHLMLSLHGHLKMSGKP